MSSDGDISVAEALQQLKKRARNEGDAPRQPVRPAILWPEPPLPKIRKEESGAQAGMPPRMMQAMVRPQAPAPGGAAWAVPGLGASGGMGAQRFGMGPLPGSLGGAGGARPHAMQFASFGAAGAGMNSSPSVPFGPAMPPGGAAAGPALANAGLSVLGAGAVAGPGQIKVSFEIPQDKVALVLGKQAGTISAIKLYTKASTFIEQNTPDEDHAMVTVVGTPADVEKCKQMINALSSGMMTTNMVFQLAGLPAPADSTPATLQGLGVAAPAPSPSPAPVLSPAAALPATMPTALPKPSLPALPSGMLGYGTALPSATPPGLAMPQFAMPAHPQLPQGMPQGMPQAHSIVPQDTQIQEKLNDYYAQWWTQYATQQQPGGEAAATAVPGEVKKVMAFDPEALAKLAQQAAAEEDLPAPIPTPMPEALAPTPAPLPSRERPLPALVGDLTERATQEVRNLLQEMGAVPNPGTAQAPFSGSMPSAPPMGQTAHSEPYPAAAQGSLSGLLNGGFQIRPQQAGAAAPKANKDNDSVLKMLQTMQGNVIQASTPVANPMVAQGLVKPRGPAEALQGFESLTPGAQEAPARSDPQVEAVINRLQNMRPEMIDTVSKEMIQTLTGFQPEQVVEVLMKMETTTGFSRGEFGGEIGKVLAPRLREFTGSQFTSLMATFMSWLSAAEGGSAAEKARPFFVSASTEMATRLMEFAPHEINCCLASLISSGFSELRFFAQVGRAALARHSSFGPIQLTVLLSLLSEVRLVHLDLFNAAAQFIYSRTKELRKVDLMRFARSFAKCNLKCDPICQAVGSEVMSRIKRGDKAGDTPFKVEDLCELSWIFCCLQSYHEELFRHMMKMLEETPQVATDALCSVYEIHLVLASEHTEAYAPYRIDPDGVKALMEHYKANRTDSRRCSAKLRNDVTTVLKSLVEGTVSANHRTSTGLLVDVAALRKKTSTDGFIHVEIDSAMSVIRALDQEESSPTSLLVEGPVALRRRILEKHGLIIVCLRESEWKNLDDSRDKRRHLRAQLSALSDVLE